MRFHGEITAPMIGLLGDWANLLLRWTHFVAGIAWIGSSFYFIWLDRALAAPAQPRPGVEEDLWMVHSGGFGAAPPPAGVPFDTPESIAGLAERIRVRAVETRTMPLADKTGMTAAERALLARWIAAGAPLR